MATARVTKTKVGKWQKDLERAHDTIERVEREVLACAGNPKVKHYNDLCDLKVTLRRTGEWVRLVRNAAERIRA